MQSSAKTVQEYLKELPVDRREAINAVRGVILANLAKGYEEYMRLHSMARLMKSCVPGSV